MMLIVLFHSVVPWCPVSTRPVPPSSPSCLWTRQQHGCRRRFLRGPGTTLSNYRQACPLRPRLRSTDISLPYWGDVNRCLRLEPLQQPEVEFFLQLRRCPRDRWRRKWWKEGAGVGVVGIVGDKGVLQCWAFRRRSCCRLASNRRWVCNKRCFTFVLRTHYCYGNPTISL